MAEVYSPPRVAKMAKRLGMKAGWSLDLTGIDESDNEQWDFSRPEQRARAREVLFKGQAVYVDSIANVHGILQI